MYLLSQPALTDLAGDQIAVAKHKFGAGWAIPSNAILLLASGGLPDLYTPQRQVQFYATCYGTTYAAADRLAAALIGVTKKFTRSRVILKDQSEVLLVALNQYSELAQTWEPQLHVPAFGLYLEAFTMGVSPQTV